MSEHGRIAAALIPKSGTVVAFALALALFALIGWWTLLVFPAVLVLDAFVEGIWQGVEEAMRGSRSHARRR